MNCSIANSSLCSGELIPYITESTVSFGPLENCSQPCDGIYLNSIQLNFLKFTITIFSAICLASSFFTIAMYVINYRIIRHPEAPIYYISLCYIGISFSHIVSNAVSNTTIRCDSKYTNYFNTSSILHNGLDLTLCAVLFSILYYSTLATWFWSLVMTVEWFVCLIRKKYLSWKWLSICHIVGWALPLPFLCGALPSSAVSGNVALQTCWITDQNDGPYQLIFLIIPLLFVIFANSVILLVGFLIGTYKNRTSTNSCSTKIISSPTISILARTSAFCVIFLIINSFTMGCYLYEYTYQNDWEIIYLQTQLCTKTPSCYPHSDVPSGFILSIFLIRFIATELMSVLLLLWLLRKDILCCHILHKSQSNDDNNVMDTTINSGTVFSNSISLVSYQK